jgi:hypothetical protein
MAYNIVPQDNSLSQSLGTLDKRWLNGFITQLVDLDPTTELPHIVQVLSLVTKLDIATKADLIGGKIDPAQIPDIVAVQTFTVDAEEDLVTLTQANPQDLARTSDNGHIYLCVGDPTDGDNWVDITGSGGVVLINGKAGIVILDLADFPQVQQALALKADKAEVNGAFGLVQSVLNALTAALPGKADLVGGRIPTSQLPLELTKQSYLVEAYADLVTLINAHPGDMATVTGGEVNVGHVFLLIGQNPQNIAHWLDFTESGGVASVNGKTGAITLYLADIPGAELMASLNYVDGKFDALPFVTDENGDCALKL